jgi:hypothetical protein
VFLLEHAASGEPLVSSAEVLRELMHSNVPVSRLDMLDAALTLAFDRCARGGVHRAKTFDRTLASVFMA